MSELATTSDWAALAGLTPEVRHESMVKAFGAISVLDDEARTGNCAALLDQEAVLDDAAMQAMAASRLRALAAMDPEAADRLNVSYEKAEKQQPAAIGMRRVFALQAAAKGLSLDEVSKLEVFMPTIREVSGLLPPRSHEPIAAGDLAGVPEPAPRKGFFSRLFSRS